MESNSSGARAESYDLENLNKFVQRDTNRVLRSKTELFLRDTDSNYVFPEGFVQTYFTWYERGRYSRQLLFSFVARLRRMPEGSIEEFCNYWLRYDVAALCFKTSKFGPDMFYRCYAMATVATWLQQQLDSKATGDVTSAALEDNFGDLPSSTPKIEKFAEKLLLHPKEPLTVEEISFLVHFFDDTYCRPLENERYWISKCSCMYDRENVDPHHHICSGCGKQETPELKLKVCGRCARGDYTSNFKRMYCSETCQRDHWTNAHRDYHKTIDECLADNWPLDKVSECT